MALPRAILYTDSASRWPNRRVATSLVLGQVPSVWG